MPAPEENMKATPEDKLGSQPSRSGGFPVKAVLIVAVIVAGLFLLFYPSGDETVQEPVSEAPVVPAAPEPEPLPPAEDIPAPVEPVTPAPREEAPPVEEEPPLPAPRDSDPLMREQIVAAGVEGELGGFAEGDNLVQRLVALVDGGSRGVVLRKILPMKAPGEPFAVDVREDGMYLDPAGYERYDSYVDAVVALDSAAIADSFHALRPLYETAYAELGLPADDLDNAVIRTLDRIIATPDVSGPIALERKSVMYTYADPELEALPAIQKQLLRMGPDNIQRLKAKARELREGLLSPGA
ncbi:DUF3014 domain-containing protein [Parahaliea mediterranea]|uniref:DUF3014 domain-containing protein n=1 Tax=Parahaliea mediterranea TaxID=651086 RepID=A0A939DHZ6_9GAMM|nr:DUF3014 domain-containing protein [Parahaliea mediterranea]MBN7798619.1 DUF3014 domain-containing protein [Parahaliea mediterranea]